MCNNRTCANCAHCDKASNIWICWFDTWYRTTNTADPGSTVVWANGAYVPESQSELGPVMPYDFCSQFEKDEGQESCWKRNLEKFLADKKAEEEWLAEQKRKEEEVKAREAAWAAYDNLPWYRKLWTKCPAF